MAATVQQLVALGASREQIEDWCRERTQSYAVPHPQKQSFIVFRVLGKFIMCGMGLDIALTPHLALDGIWEPWVTMAVARHVQPGMRCMDVGACYGYYALLMADIVGSTGAVEAWEPVWDHVVSTNASLNGKSITVRRNLMGTGRDQYRTGPQSTVTFNAGDVRHHKSLSGGVPMEAPEAAAWDFIKIDVEGAEADVWQALAGVREVSPNLTVCMEFTPKQHADPRAFLEQIRSDGFILGSVGHDGVPRLISVDRALVPDTGDFRMLWLTKAA